MPEPNFGTIMVVHVRSCTCIGATHTTAGIFSDPPLCGDRQAQKPMGEDVVKDIKFQRHWTAVHPTCPPVLGVDERIDKIGLWIVYPVSLPIVSTSGVSPVSWLFRGLSEKVKNSSGGWLLVGCFAFLFLALCWGA